MSARYRRSSTSTCSRCAATDSIGLVQAGPKVNIAGGGVPELVPAIYADRGLMPTVGIPLQAGSQFHRRWRTGRTGRPW